MRNGRNQRLPTLLIALSATFAATAGASGAAESPPDGAALFESTCIRCHGKAGAGNPELADGPGPLAGELSVAQLADVIAETMPEDDPGTLSADDAHAVAAYIHDAFYSPIARARNQPPRIELARLTVAQHRRAVADLFGASTHPLPPSAERGNERGLRGEYFQVREPGADKDRTAERTDAAVDFNFGVDAPIAEIKEPHGFSIRWTGSMHAPETGAYDIVVRTDHAARLWLNDLHSELPLIDGWVKSGDQTEYVARVYLIGGRRYPLKLEFSKAKQGVDDSKDQKETPPSKPAFVALLWRRPHGAVQVIPPFHLDPQSAPESFACTTPFPPDDRSYGWERGTAVSKEWDAATTAAAIEAADYVAENIERLSGVSDGDDERMLKLQPWCRSLVETAFRTPLDAQLGQRYVDGQFEAADNDPDAAVRRVVLLALKSPRFLFREVAGDPRSKDQATAAYATAARLSFGLWDSLPDDALLTAARSGQLATPDQLRTHAERMLADPRAHAKLYEFLLAWLDLDQQTDLRKDAELYPDCDDEFFTDLKTSLELTLDEILASDGADYRRLLLDDQVYLNARLANVFGVELSGSPPAAAGGYQRVRLNEGRRAGVLTHPYMMARFSHASVTSPIHRGVFLARGMLGQALRPPPEAFTPLAPELHPGLTTRERVALQTEAAACMTCHRIINPLGFTLERYDAIGRWRDREGDKPVDDVGAFQTSAGDTVALHGARELAEYVAASHQGHGAFVEQLFHHLVQQPVEAYGAEMLPTLRRTFAAHDFNIRRLAAEIMVATAGQGRETTAEPLAAAP